METNPYQAPRADEPARAATEEVSEVEGIRRAHLFHETSLRAFGAMFGLAGILCTTFPIFVTLANAFGHKPAWFEWAAVLLATGLIHLGLGWGLSRLRRGARLPAAGWSVLVGLIGSPVTTPFCGFLLYLVLSRKGTAVLSPPYQAVVAATGPRQSFAAGCLFTSLLFGSTWLLILWNSFR